ncbi:hypothetical protein ACFX2I_007619 [Malus domestica]
MGRSPRKSSWPRRQQCWGCCCLNDVANLAKANCVTLTLPSIFLLGSLRDIALTISRLTVLPCTLICPLRTFSVSTSSYASIHANVGYGSINSPEKMQYFLG